MTETHKIRCPEWPHIHERDNRIIELEAEVERLRVWERLAVQLWHAATPDPGDGLSRKAFVEFLAAADDQLEKEQGKE